ncbi:MAG: hypothetical protein PHW74_02375 [Desulfobacca sp.]|nr:hypothetical protein [Desulfobacca sp.]
MRRKIYKLIIIGCLFGIITASPVRAEEDKPSASLSVDILSQYIWRGYALSRDSAVLQPSITIGYKGLAVNIWGNFDTDQQNPFSAIRDKAKWNETDFTLSYSRELYSGTAIKSISLDLGTIYYALDGVDDSWEIFGGLAADINYFTLAVTTYREASHYPGWWVQVGLGRSFAMPLAQATLNLGHDFIFQFSDDAAAYPDPDDPNKAFDGPLAGHLYASMDFPVHKYITISPKMGFWYALGGDATALIRGLSWDGTQNHVYGGLNLTFAF